MKTWAFLLVLLVIFVIFVYLKQQWMRRHYPPGPLSLPVIGSMWLMVFGAYTETLIQLAKQYGNIYAIWMGHIPIVVLSGFQTVKEGLVDYSEEFSDRPQTPIFKFIGKENGIAVSNGHIWKQHRRFALVTLRKLGLGKKGMERQIEQEAQQLVETFAQTKGQPFDPTTPIVKSVSNVICALTFGHPFSPEDKNFQKLIGAADNALRFLGSFSHILYEMFPWLMKHLPGPHKKIISDMEEMFSFARKEIKNHKEQQSLHDPQDFIDFYLLEIEKSKNDPDSVFREENLIHCIHDFFLAGSDTTVLSLKWALLLLTSHPDIQGQPFDPSMPIVNSVSNVICALTFGHRFALEDKNFQRLVEAADSALRFLGGFFRIFYEMFPWLMKHLPGTHKKIISNMEEMFFFARTEIKKHKEQQSLHDPQDFIDFYLLEIEKVEKVHKEIEDVLGSSRLISYQDVKRLPYTNAVIHEMQRFRYALLFGLPRQCAKDVNIHGFLIPKQWETPEEFNPNHFLDKEGNFEAKEAYLPFGAGARVCPGEQLAKTEVFIFLTSLLRTFRFQLPEGVKELNQNSIQGITTPPHPYKICAVPQGNSV
ncbi:hypothetical protein JRQ81_017713 [Phrynocephalus forsythii]|uniref:Cytochrome P450 n=1 Tax=Phrynocephalus forsythii TaxID=171643 RepID=A0A9Q0XRG4_9SAUR|nr:hypothetical protein JRQ81_017713 [Phrynocephalus forsythii]